MTEDEGTQPRAEDRTRLSRSEVLGAWLGLWTPPRGVQVPPVPWKRVAAGAAVLLLVVGAALAAIVPQITEGKQSAADREREAAEQRRAEFLASLDTEQAPKQGVGRKDPVRAAGQARRAARAALLEDASTALAADARRRERETIRGADCEPFPKSATTAAPVEQLDRPAAAYQCVAVTARFDRGEGNAGVIGVPYRLVVRFGEGRYAFCRIIPLSDRDRLSHPLPAACRL